MTKNGSQPIKTPAGNTRMYVEDGDKITFTAWAGNQETDELAGRRVGFGECSGVILPAVVD